MRFLNLTEGFKPYTSLPGQEIGFESFFFSGGEPHIKLDVKDIPWDSQITITSRVNSANDFMMLLAAMSALKEIPHQETFVFIPYFPGARQDRVMVPGEPLTAVMYTDILNECYQDFQIQSYDLHSDVVPACLENGDSHYNNHKFIEKVVKDILAYDERDNPDLFDENLVLVSPDAGSNKKIYKLAQHLDVETIVKCDKTRDIESGKLSGFEVYSDNLAGLDCLIVDDICDGGGTFIGLAEELKRKGAGKVYLAVSHGIFSKGFEELEKHFTCIYTTDSIFSAEDVYAEFFLTEKLKQIKLNEVIWLY